MKHLRFESLESNDTLDLEDGGFVLEGTILDIRGPLEGGFHEIVVRRDDGSTVTIALDEEQFADFKKRMEEPEA